VHIFGRARAIFCARGPDSSSCSYRARQKQSYLLEGHANVSSGIGSVSTAELTCVEKLAQLFSTASPMRLPVAVTATIADRRELREQAVIEFGTAQEVLFGTTLPLEFEDQVRLVNSDGSFDARAAIIAVRYDAGRKAVAARFAEPVRNWIIKP
jgi:hypothetical protein